jgi:hypothetical protein
VSDTDRIAALEQAIDQTQSMVKTLAEQVRVLTERLANFHVDTGPVLYGPIPRPHLDFPTHWPPNQPVVQPVPSCPKCGIKLDGAMGYVCPRSDCPTQAKAT